MTTQQTSRRLSFFYACGTVGYIIGIQAFNLWLPHYYLGREEVGDLVPSLLFGVLIFGSRIFDAVLDPLIASLSDRSESKLGRRRTFMFIGAPIMALGLAIPFFTPFGPGSTGNIVWLVLALLVFFPGFTTFVVPYWSWLPELSLKNNPLRVQLSTYKGAATMIGAGFVFIGSNILIGLVGFHGMILAVVGVCLFMLLLTPAFISEPTDHVSTVDLRSSLTQTLQNRKFVVFLVVTLGYWFGLGIFTQIAPFYSTVLLDRPEQFTGVLMGTAFLVAVLSAPAIGWLTRNKGKVFTILFCMVYFAVALPAFYFVDSPPIPVEPKVWAIAWMAIIGVPMVGLSIVPHALLADICEEDAIRTGEHREGMYYAVQGVCTRLCVGLALLTITVLFHFFGKTTAEPLGVKLTGPTGAIVVLVTAAIFYLYYPRYPITENLSEDA